MKQKSVFYISLWSPSYLQHLTTTTTTTTHNSSNHTDTFGLSHMCTVDYVSKLPDREEKDEIYAG